MPICASFSGLKTPTAPTDFLLMVHNGHMRINNSTMGIVMKAYTNLAIRRGCNFEI